MLERIEKDVIDRNGQPLKLVKIREKRLPPEFRWILFVKKLMERGYLLKFVYRIDGSLQEFGEPRMWDLDIKQGAPSPRVPEKIRVLEYENGRGFVEKMIIEDVEKNIDPTVEQSLLMFNMLIG